MLSFLIHPALTVTALIPAAPPVQAAVKNDELGAPGLVAHKGGTTYIGSDKKDIEALMEEIPAAANSLRALDAETPQNRVPVSPFQMGVTEVTNEQYAAFVRATGHRPPQSWGKKALDDAAREFLVNQGKENEERRKKGDKPIREEFDKPRWWSAHWPEAQWAIPDGESLMPVTYVDYADAQAYCKWAGVRLPTEYEYQHAVRGSTKDPFPWGDAWEDGKYAGTNELKGHNSAFKVAHFPEGVSKEGLYELSGNVWEWTSSSYVAYDKFKKNKYKVNKKEELPEPRWDGNQRVAVGGSFQNGRVAARCTARRPTERSQLTNALGFRIAATPRAGVDIANALHDTEVRNSDARPTGVVYVPEQVIAMDRWDTADASADAPPGYAVIGGYEYLVFAPIEELEDTQDAGFRRKTLVAPQHLGFLSISVPMVEPAMPAGTYLVAFRAKGEAQLAEPDPDDKDDPDKADEEKPKKTAKVEDPLAALIDIEADNLLFFDARSGELVAHSPTSGVTFGKGDGGGKFTPMIKTIKIEDPADPKKKIDLEEHWLRLEARVPTKIRKRILPFTMEFKPEDGVLQRNWRK